MLGTFQSDILYAELFEMLFGAHQNGYHLATSISHKIFLRFIHSTEYKALCNLIITFYKERYKITSDTYLGPSQTTLVELFAKILWR